MADYNKFNAFVADIANGKHNLASDQLKVALTNIAPAAADGVLADITEIDYTNLSARDLSVTGSDQVGGTYKLQVEDLTLAAAGGPVGPFRYVVIYNDTATGDELIGFYDYGSEATLNDGETFALDADETEGIIQLS